MKIINSEGKSSLILGNVTLIDHIYSNLTCKDQVWGQIHWNVFKYKNKYFSFGQIQIHSFVSVFKYKYFWNDFKYKYFSNEKNKFIIFPLLFILIHTLYNITPSIRFVTSIYEFFCQNFHQSDDIYLGEIYCHLCWTVFPLEQMMLVCTRCFILSFDPF